MSQENVCTPCRKPSHVSSLSAIFGGYEANGDGFLWRVYKCIKEIRLITSFETLTE